MEHEFKGVKHQEPKLNLFFNYYQSRDRQEEIDACFKVNKEVFDRVILAEGRPSFRELFELSNEYPNDINCFCNSDIYFDKETVKLLHTIKPNECYALTRWDFKGFNKGEPIIKFFGRVDSQDAWVFRGAPKGITDIGFTQGMWGCDNRLAFEIKKAGYEIKNPSLTIKTIHLHAIDNRNQTRAIYNTVPPPYLTLVPNEL